MTYCNWETISGFSSPGEYQRFCCWLDAQVAEGIAEEIPVGKARNEVPFGFYEKWFRCKENDKVWRLVAPDAPFRGLWAEVE
jgi:hypothetical protein